MNLSNKICLLCLEKNDNLLEINGQQGIDLNVATILREHFWFEVDAFAAKGICQNCWINVENFDIFYNFVKSNHQQTLAIDYNALVRSIKEEELEDIKEVFENIIEVTDINDLPASICDELEVDSNTAKEPATVKHKRKYTRRTSASPPAKRYKTDVHAPLLSQCFNMACELCDTPLPTFRETKKHYKDVHLRPGYLICKICDSNKKYLRLPHMLSHCEWHINPTSFKCKQCPRTFREKYGLHFHYSKFHAPEAEKLFKCNYCDEKFSRESFLKSHRMNHHPPQYKCPICQESILGKLNLRAHIRDNHTLEDEREYRRNMKSVTRVDRVKEEDKPFECDICGYRSATFINLKIHISRYHRDGNFHRTHGEVYSHICEICARPFKTSIEQVKHYLKVHSNQQEEKVQCDICGKWLKHKGGLANHFRWHNKKPSTCKICGRVCSSLKAMQSHIRTAHREPWLECVACGKKFKFKLALKEHMAIHAGITDLYKCPFCPKTCRSNANMYTHRKRVHPTEQE